MRNLCRCVLLLFCAVRGYAQNNSYLFVWAVDDAKKSSDFLAVLDADAASPRYGQSVASATEPRPSADTTVVNLDAHAKFTPFEQMIIGKEKEVLDLSAKGDYTNWANLLSDGAVAVYDTGYASKPEVLKALKVMSDIHCSMDKVKVMPIGKTAALIIYRMTQDWKEQGKPVALQYYISSLWVKRGGKWLSQFWQETDARNSYGGEEKTVQNQNNSITNDTKELLQIETDLLNAYVHRDLSVRDRYVADEFVGVDSSGRVYSKQQDMQELKEGTFAMKSFSTEDVQVRLFGDSAIVTGRNISTSVYKGKEQTDTFRYVDTFLKRDGRWEMAYSQDTNVANTTATSGEPDDAVLKAIVANDEKQIIALEKRLWNGDANEISKLEAEDYEVIKHAHRYHRADDETAAKDVKFALTSMDDIRVRMLRPDVALITYHATQKGSFRGVEVPPSLYFGSIWVNRSGDWKNVFLEENEPDVFTDIYKPSADRAQPQAPRGEVARSQSLDDGNLSTQALAKEREILDAQNRNDWTAFAELLADDLVAIDEDGIHSKKELLEEVRAAEVHFSGYKMESVKVIPQTNGAIVAYKETLFGTERGKPFTWHIYTHSHWERRGGKWLMTMFQDSTAKD